jgi:hypothetical protein
MSTQISIKPTSSTFGMHVLTKPLSGVAYTNMLNSTTLTTFSPSIGDILYLFPFLPKNSITIDEINIEITTNGPAGSLLRILAFSDDNGVPHTKLLESPSLDTSTTGYKTYTTSYTFEAGNVYYLGIYNTSGSIVLRGSSSTTGASIILGTFMNSPVSRNCWIYSSLSITSIPSILPTADIFNSQVFPGIPIIKLKSI